MKIINLIISILIMIMMVKSTLKIHSQEMVQKLETQTVMDKVIIRIWTMMVMVGRI